MRRALRIACVLVPVLATGLGAQQDRFAAVETVRAVEVPLALESVDGRLTRVMRNVLRGARFDATADWRTGIDLPDMCRLDVDAVRLLADMPTVADY